MSYYEEDVEDYDEDERPRSARGRKNKVLRNIKRRISVVVPTIPKKKERDDEEEEDSFDGDDDEFGFDRRQPKKKKKKKKRKQLRKNSMHNDGLSRSSGASRTLRLTLSASNKEEDEDGDVPMPLPGQQQRGDDTVNSRSSNNSKKRSLRMIKNALSGSTNNSGNKSTSSGNGSKKIKNKSTTRRRLRRKNNASDGSLDSPPSVASTENSVDLASRPPHQHAQLRQQARQQQQQKNNSCNNNLPRLFNKRAPDDETGAQMEAMSMDYYYQSLPWIIKTWIYFLTVVVPFTLLYYCFVGIFHSTTLHSNPFLKHVSIANVLFNGLGCTFRSDFWARQALDAKGVHAKGVVLPMLGRTNTGSNRDKRLPRRNRSRNSTREENNNNKLGGAFMRTATLNVLRPRNKRRSAPNNNNHSNTTATGNPKLGRSMTPTAIMSRMGNHSERISTPKRVSGGASSHNNNHAAPRHSSAGGETIALAASVWDAEKFIPKSKKKESAKPRRSPMEKHKSILEILEVHENDEKVALLQ